MNMPRLKYFLQCDDVKQENGKLCPVGLFDTIYALTFPTAHPKMYLMLGFVDAEPGIYDVEIHICDPQGREDFGKVEGKVESKSMDQTINMPILLEKFPLPEAGEYKFIVYVQGDFLCEYSFRAIQSESSNVVQSANIDVECPKCHSKHRFQIGADPKFMPEIGFLPFPPGDVCKCTCGNEIDLSAARKEFLSIISKQNKNQ